MSFMESMHKKIFVLIASAAVAGCSLFGGDKSVQTQVAEHPPAENKPYMIGKDDMLEVIVWKDKDLSGDVLVAGDGTVTIPLVGRVPAAGKTADELQADLKQRLGEYVKDPNVTVRIKDAKSRIIYVLGEVKKPGSFPLHSGEVLSQAIADAGGFSDFADPSSIRLVRRNSNQDVQMTINYKNVSSGKDLTADVPLQSGDTVTVF